MDYTHQNALRISNQPRRILRNPADQLRDGLAQSVNELGEKREGRLKVKRESEVARKYFANLYRESSEGKQQVRDVDLEGPTPSMSAVYQAEAEEDDSF